MRTGSEGFLKYRKETEGALQKENSRVVSFFAEVSQTLRRRVGIAEMIDAWIKPGPEDRTMLFPVVARLPKEDG